MIYLQSSQVLSLACYVTLGKFNLFRAYFLAWKVGADSRTYLMDYHED